mgnify:CR=1 FL=1
MPAKIKHCDWVTTDGKKLFPVGEQPTYEERKALNLDFNETRPIPTIGFSPKSVACMPTGEKRPPKKGEWYLSGAIVHGYRAPNDLSIVFHIAKLVKVRTVVRTSVEVMEVESGQLLS